MRSTGNGFIFGLFMYTLPRYPWVLLFFHNIFFDLSNMPQFRQIPSIQIMQDIVRKRVPRGTALGVGVVASTVNPAQITDSVSLAWRKTGLC